ncbi:efflux RND transporter periplasmic adaptor subunit [Flammeovirga yaeyamensis]|uniref:Efflux RND transporter periplasmic adaptor subunit n=1 Tax=Flammeovirga yaeyamensis TaxID=367791 RepID=A0AAX1MYC5_9BACT|nr:efflux RND transporter periplasmic adaptor subunit [Flammeovirga yaeyamensis]MBB3696160.1 Cu(I)/Ag(I) efflux system membrane fusion protein [Flammeovirga yaeyamensis]NMF34843.1 efflux RND transporter periplasmic adaptor subunit [Flammeovirga yaeyamensis]QWG00329.1 efflux RND transporter periplasmic adaptor subunit [Flammeovirga yaeyamensis]
MKKYIQSYSVIIIVFIIGLFSGWLFFAGESSHKHKEHKVAEKETQWWTCSMHPQIRQQEPGDCPICGMDLIPASSGNEGQDLSHISLSPSAVALANIQTTQVTKQEAEKELTMQGKVAVDERRTFSQTAHFSGRIEKSFVNYIGERVRKGQKLATIYSPQLVTAQREYFEAKKVKERNPQLLRSAIEKLRLWKLTDQQIEEIDRSGKVRTEFDIKADISGVITKLNVVEGDHIMEGQVMYDVADLSRLWVKFDAYESDLAWLKTNDKITFTVSSYPGQNFSTKIDFIDPFINPKTRVASVRGSVYNKGGKLKPEMFVTGKVMAKLPVKDDVIVVPKTAVLWTGPRSIVYVKVQGENQPTFEMREVVMGTELSNAYIIKEGLKQGEEVVTQGTYTVDAAAQLKGKPSMINPKKGMDHDHMHMDMSKMEKHQKFGDDLVSEVFRTQLQKAFQSYIMLKDALVASDDHKTSELINDFEKSLEGVKMNGVKGDAHMYWMMTSKALKGSLTEMSNADNIDTQRRHFVEVSKEMINLITKLGLPKDQKAYLMYCPMANDDLGASWLSNVKEVRNPYYGDMMLKCGAVKEEIQ